MWTYGFFNSVNGDRTYNAQQMSSIFEGLITDGVYEAVGNKMAVQPNSGMVIQIATGRGFFKRHWVNNDSEYMLTLEGSDVLLNRYVAVCIRVDDNDSVRNAVPYLKYSDFATNPVKPAMTRSEKINEYCLAYVYIPAKAAVITAANIEDTRQDNELCGWVTGLINQITPDTLYTQFTAQFNEWFSGLVDIIDEDVEIKLVNALPATVTVSLPVSEWEAVYDGFTQTVTVNNMNATKSVIVQPNTSSVEDYAQAEIKAISQSTNSLTFKCKAMPTTDVYVDVLHMGV